MVLSNYNGSYDSWKSVQQDWASCTEPIRCWTKYRQN